ncbi:AEC family transporter [Chitinibacteraceae bacterium HSL-7]
MSALASQIFAVMAPVLIIVLIGWGYARHRPVDLTDANRLNVELLSPLLVFSAWVGRDVALASFLPLIAASVGVVLGTGLIAWVVARLAGWPWRAFVPPMMFANTGNIGLPLMLLAFGDALFPAAIAIFVTVSLLHFTLGVWLMQSRMPLSALLRIPMVWALLAGLAVQLAGVTVPAWLLTPASLLGQVAIPLMLFSLGVRLATFRVTVWRAGLVGAVLGPVAGMLLAALLAPLLGVHGAQYGMLLVFAALPPAVLNYLFAEQYGQSPDLVAGVVVAGTLAALLFIPVALALVL